MDLLFLGGLGYLVSKVTANVDENVSENMSNDTVYSSNSSNKLKNSLKKKAIRRKKLSKAEKKHYDNAMKHFKKANDILSKNLKDSGIKSRFAGL